MLKLLIRTTLYLALIGIATSKIQSQETGYLIIETNVSEFLLVVDDDFYNYLEVVSGDTLALSPGIELSGKPDAITDPSSSFEIS